LGEKNGKIYVFILTSKGSTIGRVLENYNKTQGSNLTAGRFGSY
jgi:hypothetical protein